MLDLGNFVDLALAAFKLAEAEPFLTETREIIMLLALLCLSDVQKCTSILHVESKGQVKTQGK